MTKPDRLEHGDKARLDAIVSASPELAAVTASVRDFAATMNERRGGELPDSWMTGAPTPISSASAFSSQAKQRGRTETVQEPNFGKR